MDLAFLGPWPHILTVFYRLAGTVNREPFADAPERSLVLTGLRIVKMWGGQGGEFGMGQRTTEVVLSFQLPDRDDWPVADWSDLRQFGRSERGI